MVLSKCLLEITIHWIAAEDALKHARKKSTLIDHTFHQFIPESDYYILAGFDELLIKSGVGHLEQVHIFVSTEVNASSPLLSELGKICSPFSSRLFTESSSYLLPIYKDDGTVLEFNELVRLTALKFADGRYSGKLPITMMNSSPPGGQDHQVVSSGQGIGGHSNSGQGSGGHSDGVFGGGGGGSGGGGGASDMGNRYQPKRISFEINSYLHPSRDDQNFSQILTTDGCLTLQVLLLITTIGSLYLLTPNLPVDIRRGSKSIQEFTTSAPI